MTTGHKTCRYIPFGRENSLVGFQAFRPASWIATWNRDAAPQRLSPHGAKRNNPARFIPPTLWAPIITTNRNNVYTYK